MQNTRMRKGTQAGFSLIEVMVTTVVVGTAMVATTWSLAGAARAQQGLPQSSYTATLLAKEIHALALTLPKAPSGQLAATSPAGVAALDSLVGASFSPPIRADLKTDSGLSDWTQRVALAVFDTSDLTTPTHDDPAAGLTRGAQKVYRLTVTIEHGGTVVDTANWWLAP